MLTCWHGFQARSGRCTHLAVLALVALTLPLGVASGFAAPRTRLDALGDRVVRVFHRHPLHCVVGYRTAFATLVRRHRVTLKRNPYVLYAASNLGSVLRSVVLPIRHRAVFDVTDANTALVFWLALFSLCISAAAFIATNGQGINHTVAEGERLTWRRRAAWPLLTSVPAGLCIAVTSYITTDLASAPFLWMLPLALYLLTFVAVFRDRPWVPQSVLLRLLPYVLAPLAISLCGIGKTYWFANILLNLVAFTLISLACHGEAYRLRPQPQPLTEFYLWTSFGGVLGGVFAGLTAPHLFNNTYEYPILIVASLSVLPGIYSEGARHFWREAAPGLTAAALALALWFLTGARLPLAAEKPMQVALVFLAALMLFQAKRPARFAGLVVFAFVLTELWRPGLRQIEIARSFFGACIRWSKPPTAAIACF